MKTKLRLAVCQIRTETDKNATMEKAAAMIKDAADKGADIAVLPEMFNCPYSSRYFRSFAENENGESLVEMSRWAKKNGIILVGGSVPEKDGDKMYNTCYVFDRDGELIAKHRKAHMFDVQIENGVSFRESKHFSPGNEITVFDTEFGKVGVMVCFDIRFPELCRSMAERGAKLIFCPAQFNMTTGPKHWELSLRARAMDNELFFVGASAARYEGFDYECWGHSAVVSPFGDVIASCDETEQLMLCDIDLSQVDSVRQQLPTVLSLREDLETVSK